MKIKFQSFIFGRVGEARIETNLFPRYILCDCSLLVSIRPAKNPQGYSTNGLLI